MTTKSFSTSDIKKVGVDHYGEERRQIRAEASKLLPPNPRILELYGSGGNMTTFYRENCSQPVIVGVDTAPGTDYQMDNKKFVQTILPNLEAFDLIDFDAYGSPNPLIYTFFNSCRSALSKKKQFIIVSTDGLGLAMKQNPRLDWMKFFLILDPEKQIPDLRRPWDHHLALTEHFFQTIGQAFNWNVRRIEAIQAKGKNFVLAAYLFENPTGGLG